MLTTGLDVDTDKGAAFAYDVAISSNFVVTKVPVITMPQMTLQITSILDSSPQLMK